jgi:hypothetical protein
MHAGRDKADEAPTSSSTRPTRRAGGFWAGKSFLQPLPAGGVKLANKSHVEETDPKIAIL